MKNYFCVYVLLFLVAVLPITVYGEEDMPNGVEIHADINREDVSYNEGDQINSVESDYFDFSYMQSIQVSLDAELNNYHIGEKVKLIGEILNESNYPVVDGEIYARVSRKNPNFIVEGNYVVDELFLMENINLNNKERRNVELEWNIPHSAVKGEYRVDYYFLAGKKFNLGGLSYNEQLIGGSSDFVVDSEYVESIHFNGEATSVNGRNYRKSQSEFVIDPHEKVVITQPITNAFFEKKTVQITYNLYKWDGIDQKSLKNVGKDVVDIDGGATKDLNYTIPQMDESAYYLQIVAEVDGSKSIMNIRIVSPQVGLRLSYVGLTKFPIVKGENFSVISSFHNGLNMDSHGKILVLLKDVDDEEIGKIDYDGNITGANLFQKSDIIAKRYYDYIKVIAKVYDENDRLMDEYEATYDCKIFGTCSDVNKTSDHILIPKNKLLHKGLFAISILIFFVTVVLVAVKRHK